MQWLGFVILIGLLALLLIAGSYLAFREKTPSRTRRPGGYGRADFYHTEGEWNPLYNLEKLNARSPGDRRRHVRGSQRQQKHE